MKDAIFVAEVFFYAKFVKLYMFVPGQSLVYGQAGSPGWTDINQAMPASMDAEFKIK